MFGDMPTSAPPLGEGPSLFFPPHSFSGERTRSVRPKFYFFAPERCVFRSMKGISGPQTDLSVGMKLAFGICFSRSIRGSRPPCRPAGLLCALFAWPHAVLRRIL